MLLDPLIQKHEQLHLFPQIALSDIIYTVVPKRNNTPWEVNDAFNVDSQPKLQL